MGTTRVVPDPCQHLLDGALGRLRCHVQDARRDHVAAILQSPSGSPTAAHATTQRYADYAPDPTGAAALVARAFEPRINPRINLSASESKTEQQKAL